MTIYGRHHTADHPEVVTVVRLGTLDDVRTMEGRRRPDSADRVAVRTGSYVVVRHDDTGAENLYHVAFLRADGGWKEILAAIESAKPKTDPSKLARLKRGQVIKEQFDLGLVLNSGPVAYDVIWVGGSVSRYRHGQRDVRVATEQELADAGSTVDHLLKEAGAARRERRNGHRVRRGQVSPRRSTR